MFCFLFWVSQTNKAILSSLKKSIFFKHMYIYIFCFLKLSLKCIWQKSIYQKYHILRHWWNGGYLGFDTDIVVILEATVLKIELTYENKKVRSCIYLHFLFYAIDCQIIFNRTKLTLQTPCIEGFRVTILSRYIVDTIEAKILNLQLSHQNNKVRSCNYLHFLFYSVAY